jgi:hypothetical protein
VSSDVAPVSAKRRGQSLEIPGLARGAEAKESGVCLQPLLRGPAQALHDQAAIVGVWIFLLEPQGIADRRLVDAALDRHVVIAADTFLAGTVCHERGRWVFLAMTAGRALPLAVDHYYFP